MRETRVGKLEGILRTLKEHKNYLAEKYSVKEIGMFGSFTRREMNEKSDVDILVEFTDTPSLLKFINLENYLCDVLEVKVDLVMKRALKPNIGKTILKEVIPV